MSADWRRQAARPGTNVLAALLRAIFPDRPPTASQVSGSLTLQRRDELHRRLDAEPARFAARRFPARRSLGGWSEEKEQRPSQISQSRQAWTAAAQRWIPSAAADVLKQPGKPNPTIIIAQVEGSGIVVSKPMVLWSSPTAVVEKPTKSPAEVVDPVAVTDVLPNSIVKNMPPLCRGSRTCPRSKAYSRRLSSSSKAR